MWLEQRERRRSEVDFSVLERKRQDSERERERRKWLIKIKMIFLNND